MEWHDIQVDGRHTVKFSDLPYVPLTSPPHSPDVETFIGKKLGGILRHGEWAWLARNSVLHIVSLRNGQTISSYEFCESRGYESCCIKCVEEILPNNPGVMLLAVVLESFRGPGGGCSYLAVYSIELSSVLKCIELSLHLTCARFMDSSACRHSLLQNFDGCLAVGSEEGVIVLLDLNMNILTSMHNELQEDTFVTCHIVDYSLSLTEVHRNFRQCQQDGIHFGLQMEVIESPCSIQCILPIDLILGLAIGLEDGRLALYDLAELQIFYVALPTPEVTMSAIVKMDFLEPPDDPRPCLYIWALHENGENLHAVLHSIMYEKRLLEQHEPLTYFESFQTGSVRLQLPLEATKSVALSCQAISTLPTHGEDDSNCLCAISWLSVLEGKNKLLIFDLNQWYKEEMPFVLEYGKQPNYLAGYILNGECTGLHTLVNPNSIAHFNSMQRFEEHFYPNSLSFEALLLHTEGSRRYNWEGTQNRVINLLRSSNAAIFLEPNLYFNEVIRTRLMPQFIELNINSTFSQNAKYEILLSAALEHNCISLLRDCAKSWIDGSFMGNFTVSTGLSMSTLTDWMWKRATCIKSRCNDLCKSLFEFGGYPLDSREQKELGFLTRQLKLLTDLLKEILAYAKKQISDRVFNDLENKYNSLCMASSYQNILLWLLNIGLLPEASPHNDKINAGNDLIPYPYKELKEFYRNKRSFYAKINDAFISKKSGSCKLIFIDSFIEHVCKGNILHEYWLENEGNGLYPPNSLEAMLRIMLVPDLEYDNKCAILLYFFLDLNMAIDEQAYKDVVANFIKFPSVFKLSAPLIKTVQAFWNLDHDRYLAAVDEFISPFNKSQCYPQWQVELFIEVLLNQKASNLALRILESQPSLISPLLKLNTLLTNELISEAFHFVRSKNNDALLETFFTRCLYKGQFGVIRDLALSEREGLILQSILKKSKAQGAESLHFVYLLQKSKYIEAVSYMEELSNKAKSIKTSSQLDTPNLVLSAFNTTMTPVTQGLTDVYFRIKNKIKKKEVNNKSPVPLSCQLIKQNANSLLGGIYHSSALSAHFATYYWGEMEEQTKQAKNLLNSNNAPFLRRPQIDINCSDYLGKSNISYPQAYKATEKRTLLESGVLDNEPDEFDRQNIEHKLNPKKKRRLIGQEIVDDLSHFMKMKKNANNFTGSEQFTFGQEEQIHESVEQTTAKTTNDVDLLIKPVRRGKEYEDVATPVLELHGILKTHTPEPGQVQREPLVEEEKSLRFTLPSEDVSTNTQVCVEATKSKDKIEHKSISKEDQPQENINLPKLKQLSRAVSEESNKSSISSSTISEENFYSPLSSQNNSKLNNSNLSSYSFLSGPQPRKPLARLSTERSEKSLTPEPTTKAADSSCMNKSSPSDYVTALESGLKSKISSRCSLEPVTADSLEKTTTTDNVDRTESSNANYVTAIDTFSKPMTFSSSNLKAEVTLTTSGYGSMASHTTLAGSKIHEFVPKVSSSKVSTPPLNAKEENKTLFPAKLSECSTVVGSLTTFECTNTTSISIAAAQNEPDADLDKPTAEQKRQMLETTLGMSTYDISILDSTSLQQIKSSLMMTTKDVTFKSESIKADEKKTTKLEEEIECEEQLEKNKDESRQNQEEYEIEIQKPSKTADHTDYEFIVLSSSSSTSSTSSLPLTIEQQEDDEYASIYSENEGQEGDEEEEEEEEEVETDNEDNIEDDANFEFDENNDSEVTNENVAFDYDDESSISETYNSNDSANEDIIQVIEDSSSDVRQQANYYGESDSDDVKVVEETHTSLAADNIAVLVSKGEIIKDIETTVGIGKKAELNEATPEHEGDFEMVGSAGNKSSSDTAKNNESLAVNGKNPLEIEIKLNENLSTSTTEVTEENKVEDVKEDISSVGNQEQKESDSKDIVSVDIEVKLSSLKENTKNITIVEATEQTLMVLNMEDSKNESKVDINKQLEIKSTNVEKTAGTIKEKSAAIIETETMREQIEEKEEFKVNEIEVENRDVFVLCQPMTSKDSSLPPKDLELNPDEVKSITEEQMTGKVQEKSMLISETKVSEEYTKNEVLRVKEMDEGSKSITTPRKRKTLREASVPPIDLEIKSTTEEKPAGIFEEQSKLISEDKARKEIKVKEMEDDSKSTPRKRRVLKESSVPPMDLESKAVKIKTTTDEKEADKLEDKSKLIIEKKVSDNKAKREELKVKQIEDDNSSISSPYKQISLRGASVPPVYSTLNPVEEKSKINMEKNKARGESEKTEELKVKEPKDDSAPPVDFKDNPVDTKSKDEDKGIDKVEEKSKLFVEKDKTSGENKKIEEVKVKEAEDVSESASTSRKGRSSRGSSMPPMHIEVNVVAAVPSPRMNKRGISVPPQTIIESEELSNLTPRTRRSIRASSSQSIHKIEDHEEGTPRKMQKTHDIVDNKISTRRRSVLLDAINEDSVILDSPSTRTRLRSHLNSIDSDLDSSVFGSSEQLVQLKRTSSKNPSELPLTPKRTRRNSITSQPETSAAVLTPRSLRSRSALTVQEEDTESIPASPRPASNKRIGAKRKKSTNEEPTTEGEKQIDKSSPISDQSAASEFSYSSSRRLTRTQLAIMEKSAALSKPAMKDAVAKADNTISPPQNKRSTKSRSSRLSNVNADSEDAESVSSKLSTVSSVTGTKRRVTRKTVKDKDDTDDDGVSVASSLGSEKHLRSNRSKDKGSPNTTLTIIPEEAPIETKKRGRPAKH